jgi:hypothetical protein
MYILFRKNNPITGLNWPTGFQQVEAPRFQDNRHMKVVRLSALCTGHLYPPGNIPKYSWYSFLLQNEGLCQWKIPMTPSRIEPATFRLVAQCLNHMRHRVPRILFRTKTNFTESQIYICGSCKM